MPPARRQPGAAPVTRERIVDVALTVLESDGMDGLTMRALAGKLGVAVTAIYWHVGDKQALLDAIAERIVAAVGEVHPSGATPSARLVSIGTELYHQLVERPHLVAIAHERGYTAALFQASQRSILEELHAAGLRGARAAFALDVLLRYVVGAVLVVRQEERAPQPRHERAQLVGREFARSDPALARALAHPVDADAVFAESLRALVNAMVAPAARGSDQVSR